MSASTVSTAFAVAFKGIVLASTSGFTGVSYEITRIVPPERYMRSSYRRPAQEFSEYSATSLAAPLPDILVPTQQPAEEIVVAQVIGFSSLSDGWDGENACKPSQRSIDEATGFLRALGPMAVDFEPSLHADGSVMVEPPEGGTIRFLGDGSVSVALSDFRGRVRFDGVSIPSDLARALGA